MNISSTERMETHSLTSLLFRFSLPAVFSYMIHGAYHLVDRAVVGRVLGAEALSGITLVFPAIIAVFALTVLITIGTASLVSVRLGEKRPDAAGAVMGTAAFVLSIFCFGAMLLGVFALDPLLNLMGAEGAARPHARIYLQIVLLSAYPGLFSFFLASMIRAQGDPTACTVIISVGGVINILLDLFFLLVLKMGVEGAALSSAVAQTLSTLAALHYLQKRTARQENRTGLKREHFRFRPELVRKMMITGAAPCLMDMIAAFQFALLNRQLLIWGGDLSIAAMGIVFPLHNILLMLIFGIIDGMQPVFGYNFGAGRFDRVREGIGVSLFWTFVLSAIGTLGLIIGADAVVRCFARDPELIRITVPALRIFLASVPFLGVGMIGSLYFQSVEKGGISTGLMLVRQAGLLIPCIWFLPLWMGLPGVWTAAPLADMAGLIPVLWMILREMKRLKLCEYSTAQELRHHPAAGQPAAG